MAVKLRILDPHIKKDISLEHMQSEATLFYSNSYYVKGLEWPSLEIRRTIARLAKPNVQNMAWLC